MLLLACVDPDPDIKPPGQTGEEPWQATPAVEAAWAELQGLIQRQVDDDAVTGFQVAVVIDGELRYTEGFGVTEYGGDEPVTADTVFRWASVTKMHTATALLGLAEEGAVDMHAPITDVIDVELAEGFDASELTPWHLMTHSAALPDALDWSCRTGDGVLSQYTEASRLAPYAPPSSFFNYSNTGYVWVGAMLEALTGDSFPDLMRERVLVPAGMETATFDMEEVASVEHATGTSWDDDSPYLWDVQTWDCGWARPAGWLHGTAADLAKTAEWQLAGGGDLLTADSVEEMHAQLDTHWYPDASFEAGYGQFSVPYNGADIVWHDGWVSGFVSTWAIVPDAGFGVAVVSNADWADPYAVMYDAIDLFVQPDGETPDYSTDPATWDVYTGSYLDPNLYGRIDVTLVGNRLRVDLPDLGTTATLTQEAGDQFWIQFEDGEWDALRFIADETGEYRWFVLRTAVGERADEVALAARAPVDPAHERAVRRRYGPYVLGESSAFSEAFAHAPQAPQSPASPRALLAPARALRERPEHGRVRLGGDG